jgi:diguanylate cyclase (GGDEF)-like protein/PAS domain S-box-containing protein
MTRPWLTIFFTLLGLGGLLGYQVYEDYFETSSQEKERLVSLASAFNVNMGEQLRASSHMLGLLAHMAPELLGEPDGVARLNARMSLLSESVTGIRSILIVNAEGIVVSSNRPELVGLNFSGSERYNTIRNGRDPAKLYVSAPFTTPLGTYTISLGKAIVTTQGEFNGYLLAVLSPDFFDVLMKSLLYAPDMRLSITHGDGKVIYSTQSTPDLRGLDLSSNPKSLFNSHKASGALASFVIDRAATTNDLRYVAFHTVWPASTVADKALVIAVSRDASAVLDRWKTSAIHIAGLYLGIILAVSLGYLALARRKTAYQRLTSQKDEVSKQAESIAKSERFIRSITDAMPGLVAYFDRSLCCLFANKAYVDWYQMTPEAMRGKTLLELLGESLFAKNKPYIDGVLAGEKQQFERFLTKRDGSVGHVLATYIPDFDERGDVIGFNLLVTDIKALRIAEADLKVAATVFENTADGIMVADENGVIQSVNEAFTEITGYPAQEAVGQTPRLFRSHRHEPEFHASVWRQISEVGEWKGEIWNRRKNGDVFLMRQVITRVAGKDGAVNRYISVFHDITDAWRKNERTRHLAFHDVLTDLPNRALLLERLERQIAMSERQPRCLAVLFLDLDGFKRVNDTLGHAIGDELLKAVAYKLQDLVRQTDTVARLGGDEFVVLLDSPENQVEVENIANRIIASINEPMELNGVVAKVGTSIGIAMYPEHGECASDLLKSADAAMYRAKQEGKNTYRLARALGVSPTVD